MADLLNDIQTAEFREAFNEFDKVKKPVTDRLRTYFKLQKTEQNVDKNKVYSK